MDTGESSAATVAPVAPDEPRDAQKPSLGRRHGHRNVISEAVSTLVAAVTEGGGRAIT